MPKTSLIMTAYHPVKFLTEVTMATLANITRYTDSEDYELILVEPKTEFQIRDDHKVLKIDKHIILDDDPGYYEAMNLGALEAKGKYLCFIENDIFVWEGWLEKLTYYLDKDMMDAVLPDQFPRSRDWVKNSYKYNLDQALGQAAHEQGLIIIRKSSFEKMGGWQKKPGIMGWKDFYSSMDKNGIRWGNTASVLISHIAGMTYFYKEAYEKDKLDLLGE